MSVTKNFPSLVLQPAHPPGAVECAALGTLANAAHGWLAQVSQQRSARLQLYHRHFSSLQPIKKYHMLGENESGPTFNFFLFYKQAWKNYHRRRPKSNVVNKLLKGKR
jgi:hypothetical protein